MMVTQKNLLYDAEAKDALLKMEIGEFDFEDKEIIGFKDSGKKNSDFVDFEALEFHCKFYGYEYYRTGIVKVTNIRSAYYVHFFKKMKHKSTSPEGQNSL